MLLLIEKVGVRVSAFNLWSNEENRVLTSNGVGAVGIRATIGRKTKSLANLEAKMEILIV